MVDFNLFANGRLGKLPSRLALRSTVAFGLAVFLAGCEVSLPVDSKPQSVSVGDVSLTPIKTVNSESMAIVGDAEGAVWLVTKYDVSRFPKGDLGQQQTELDPQIFQQTFNTSMNALSTAFAASDGMFWAGTWNGEVYSLDRGVWRQFISQEHGLRGKISGIRLSDTADEMWLGSRSALWRVTKKTNDLDFVMEAAIDAVALSSHGTVAAATYEGVHLYQDGRIRQVWSTLGSDQGVTALSSQASGWIVGTHDGYVELDAAGKELSRGLNGRWITAFADDSKSRVIGAWESGLWFEIDGEWYNLSSDHGLPDDSISALYLDSRQRLWIGTYGAGAFVADLNALRSEAAKTEPLA